jgi:AbrB family looped-hinge helix DNA binding protein
MNALMTVVTERGQTSIPAKIRRQLNLKPGQKLRWQQVGDNECRVFHDTSESAPGPIAMLGFARKLNPQDVRTTDEWVRELREGEKP